MNFDPYFENVKLLLHGNGANGSATIIDSSGPFPRSITGSAKITTASSKFGGSSINTDIGYAIATTNEGGLDFAFMGDFTLEMWVYPGVTASYPLMPQGLVVTNANDLKNCQLALKAGKVVWEVFSGTYSPIAVIGGSTVLPSLEWTHIAVASASGVTRIFVGGVLDASLSISPPHSTISGTLGIGRSSINTSPGTGEFDGYIDELRLTQGVARYTSNFTPHTLPHPDGGAPSIGAKVVFGQPSAQQTAAVQQLQPQSFLPVAFGQPSAQLGAAGNEELNSLGFPVEFGDLSAELGAGSGAEISIQTLGVITAFGVPEAIQSRFAMVLDGIQLLTNIPSPIAVYKTTFSNLIVFAQSFAPVVFGVPHTAQHIYHEAASLLIEPVFGAINAQETHEASSIASTEFGDIDTPMQAGSAVSVDSGVEFGGLSVLALHQMPDWYAGPRFGDASTLSSASFAVVEGIDLLVIGDIDAYASACHAFPLHMMPAFGRITIDRGSIC